MPPFAPSGPTWTYVVAHFVVRRYKAAGACPASPSVDVRMTNYFADRGFGADRKRASGQMRKPSGLSAGSAWLTHVPEYGCMPRATTCHDQPTGESGSCPALRFFLRLRLNTVCERSGPRSLRSQGQIL